MAISHRCDVMSPAGQVKSSLTQELAEVKLSKGIKAPDLVLCIGGCRPYTAEKSMSGLAGSGLPGRLLARASHRLHMDVYL